MKGSDLTDLAQQEPIRAEEPHRSRMLGDIVSLMLVLAILTELWLKGLSFDDAIDVSIAALAIALGLELLWRYRRYIPRVIVFVILPHRSGANGRDTKWPLR